MSNTKDFLCSVGCIVLLCLLGVLMVKVLNPKPEEKDLMTISEKHLNNGTYCPSGILSDVTYTVDNNKMSLSGSKESIAELLKTSERLSDINEKDIDELADSLIEEWEESREFTIVDVMQNGEITDSYIAYSIKYDENGKIMSFSGIEYISDSSFANLGITFKLQS